MNNYSKLFSIQTSNVNPDVLGAKYVRTTRFAIISSGTSGQVTIPSNSQVVLDDFGGTVDAVVTQVTSGKPTLNAAATAAGAVVATTFDSSGNWVFSGTPSAYPVAIVYRVQQQLSNFDSTATDIWGEPDYQRITSAISLGGSTDVYKDANGSQLEFRGISPGTSINVSQSATAITIGLTGPVGISLPLGSSGQVLQSQGSSVAAWSTATFPGTAAVNDMFYASATNTWARLSGTTTAVLTLGPSMIPIWTQGTTANRLLKTTGTSLSFAQAALTTDVTGILPVVNGGTGATTSTGSVGSVVLSVSPQITTPTIITNEFCPLVIGGVNTTSALALRSTSGVGTTGADIIFQTGNNGATEAARIFNTGDVGLGATTPVFRFDVLKPTAANIARFGIASSANYGVVLSADNNAGWMGNNTSSAGEGLYMQNSSNAMRVYTNSVERMRIDSSGNVGIGTAGGTNQVEVEKNQDTTTALSINNTNAGVSARSAIYVSNSSTTTDGAIIMGGTGYTGVVYWQDSFVFNSGSSASGGVKIRAQAGGLGISTDGATNASNLFVDTSGNVGIGTMTPSSLVTAGIGMAVGSTAARNSLTLYGNVAGSDASFSDLNFSNNGSRMNLIQGTRVGADTASAMVFYTTTAGSIGLRMTLSPAGNLGIGLTPTSQLHTNGTVRFQNFGAGAATFDANGNISSISDERLKQIQRLHNSGVGSLLGINPIVYKWKAESGLDTENEYTGFSAQNVLQNLPEAIGSKTYGDPDPIIDPDGNKTFPKINQESITLYSLQDRALLATLVNAVKELHQRISALEGPIQPQGLSDPVRKGFND